MKKMLLIATLAATLLTATTAFANMQGAYNEGASTCYSETAAQTAGCDIRIVSNDRTDGEYVGMVETPGPGKVYFQLRPSNEVINLRVNLLQEPNFENDKMTFREKELYYVQDFSGNKYLVIGDVIEGTIPDLGISYQDAQNRIRKFYITMSGMDGSLMLVEY